MENTICPNCKSSKFYYKYINCQDIILCQKCGFWDYYICEDSLGLSDLNEDKEKDNHLVDSD